MKQSPPTKPAKKRSRTRTTTLAIVEDPTKCGAKTRSGAPCKHGAGERTTHIGQGKCWKHGGTKVGDPRVKSGRYRTITHQRIQQLIEAHEADPDPLNLLPEIAALRALFVDYIDRYATFTDALLAWHADWQLRRRPLPEDLLISFERVVSEWEIAIAEAGEQATDRQVADAAAARKFVTILRGADDESKPRQVLDIADAHKILAEIGRMVERVEQLRSASAISRPELNRILNAMGRVVDTYVTDEPLKEKIRDAWMAISV